MKSFLKTILFAIFFFSLTILSPTITHAAADCQVTLGTDAYGNPSSADGINTGLGCIPTNPQALVAWFLSNGVSIGGGIAFLLSLYGGITIILAAGDPEKTNQGKQIISSAVTGFIFIILAVFFLRFIGANIFQLPGFER